MSVLSEILATKRTEVACRKEKISSHLMQEWLMNAPPVRDFRQTLIQAQGVGLIAEVKKASPSRGVIRENFDAVEIAATSAENGATCLSVLTDEPYFQGKLDYLRAIRQTVNTPLLRKDFIIDPFQIIESRSAGADALLLIVAALTPADLRELLQLTRNYGMAALVEVHDREEMQEALDAGADLIGINNRDLHTFRTTLKTTLELMAELPAEASPLIVSESGIHTRDDILTLQNAGVGAVLIGEALMREADIGAKMRELLG